MLNQIIIVGRIHSIKDYGVIIRNSIPEGDEDHRTFREIDIPVTLPGSLMKNTLEYCKEGDVVGIHGCIDVNEHKRLFLRANKISFLSSKQPEKEAEEDA